MADSFTKTFQKIIVGPERCFRGYGAAAVQVRRYTVHKDWNLTETRSSEDLAESWPVIFVFALSGI